MTKKIIIIEDDSVLQRALKDSLEAEKYEVIQAFDGGDGLKKIIKEKPDLIILDLLMPVKPGEWLLMKLKEKNLIDNCPLIVFSMKKNSADVGNCINQYKVKNYFCKSEYTLEKIVKKVKELIT
ncbi:MAG: response regulator [Candidatus Falkowbacteria bacterium]